MHTRVAQTRAMPHMDGPRGPKQIGVLGEFVTIDSGGAAPRKLGTRDVRRPGRTPIGVPRTIYVSQSDRSELWFIADHFGQRRRGPLVRVAIRRMLDNVPAAVLASLLAYPDEVRDPVQVNIYLGDELMKRLGLREQEHEAGRSTLVRLACRMLLAELRRGDVVPSDLTDAINSEVFNGEANRQLLISRRERREAKRRG